MPTTTDILDRINGDALAFQKARAAYDKAWRLFTMTTPEMAPEHFWPMVDSFRMVVLQTMLFRQERVAEAAADEFMRQAAVGQSRYSVSAVVHFAVSYRAYVQRAYTAADKSQLDFERGDDAYSDLMDAVVLMGDVFLKRLRDMEFRNLKEFRDAAGDVCQDSVTETAFPFQYRDDPTGDRLSLAMRLRKMIVSGENYFAMSLEEAAQKRAAYEAYQNGKEGE